MTRTLQRRHLLFGATLSPLLSRTARAAEPLSRILVVGDSQAQGLAAGLQRQFRGDGSWRVIDRSRIATGLCSPTRPLCQRSCRLNRIGTFGGADSRKWLDTDKRTKIG